MEILRTLTSDVLAKSLDGHYARQKAIVSNIANAETSNYHHREVDFQDDLRRAVHKAQHADGAGEFTASNQESLALQATHPLHFNFRESSVLLQQRLGQSAYEGAGEVASSPITPKINTSFKYRNDGNGVDLEREMVAMTKNTSKFQSLIAFQSRINQQLKGVIQEQ